MTHWARLRIHSVQIESLSVISPVASLYSIWVQKWNDFEYKIFKQNSCLLPSRRPSQKLKDALKNERCNRLTTVDPRTDENRSLIKEQSSWFILRSRIQDISFTISHFIPHKFVFTITCLLL